MTMAMSEEPDDRPVDETLWERRMQAVSLRNAGMTWQQIATTQGISPAMARRDVEAALREYMSGQMELAIARHRAVLADVQRANYGRMLGGDKDAARTILNGLEHEAKLLGMYAPTRVVTAVGEVEFSERIVELIGKVSPETLKELLSGAIRRNAAEHDQPIDAEIVQLRPDAAPDGEPVAAPPAEPPAGDAQPGEPVRGGDTAPARGEQPPAPDPGESWSNLD